MSNDIKFVNGLIVKAPREGAPDFVKGSISIKRDELIAWLNAASGEWVNVDIKESKGGKWYAAVNDWKPTAQAEPSKPDNNQFPPDEGFDDSIPF